MADFFYESSFSNTRGDDNAYGAALNFPNEPWFGDFTYKVVGARFHARARLREPARCDPLRRHGRISRAVSRPGNLLRTAEFQARGQFFTDLNNQLQDYEVRFGPRIFTAADDDFQLQSHSELRAID